MKEQWCIIYSELSSDDCGTSYEIKILYKNTLEEVKKEIQNWEYSGFGVFYDVILVTRGINPELFKRRER